MARDETIEDILILFSLQAEDRYGAVEEAGHVKPSSLEIDTEIGGLVHLGDCFGFLEVGADPHDPVVGLV